MASSFHGALTIALTGAGRLPRSLETITGALGGKNTDVARALNNIGPKERLPMRGTAARRRYEADVAKVRRGRNFETGRPGQKRKPQPDFLEHARLVARRTLAGPRLARARRDGLMMRVVAQIKVSDTTKVAVMPADAGGARRYQFVPPELVGDALDAWVDDRQGELELELERAFFAAYWEPGAADILEPHDVDVRLV